MIVISSKRHLFRRCGVAHTKESTEYPDDRFTEEELETLATEPMLAVKYVEDPEDEAEAKAKADAEAKARAEAETKAKAEADAAEKKAEVELLTAARKAIKDGNAISGGRPDVKAMEKILGRNITAADRDRAWDKINAEKS